MEKLAENILSRIFTLATSDINLKVDVRDFIDTYLGNRKFKTALDLGCGSGFYSRMLKKHSAKLIGVDLNYGALNSTTGYDLIYLADIRDFDKYVNDYDAIFLFDVIEHLEKDDGLLLLSKAIDKKAFIAIATPSKFFHNKWFRREGTPQQHRSIWSIEDFTKLGFKVWLFYREGYLGEIYGDHIVGVFDFNG
jgi:2-polyprenyl-3-methyl-5-hydroxy-6-metoxy-1,4-benzoquinol methylase